MDNVMTGTSLVVVGNPFSDAMDSAVARKAKGASNAKPRPNVNAAAIEAGRALKELHEVFRKAGAADGAADAANALTVGGMAKRLTDKQLTRDSDETVHLSGIYCVAYISKRLDYSVDRAKLVMQMAGINAKKANDSGQRTKAEHDAWNTSTTRWSRVLDFAFPKVKVVKADPLAKVEGDAASAKVDVVNDTVEGVEMPALDTSEGCILFLDSVFSLVAKAQAKALSQKALDGDEGMAVRDRFTRAIQALKPVKH